MATTAATAATSMGATPTATAVEAAATAVEAAATATAVEATPTAHSNPPPSVTTAAGTNAGLPIVANAQVIFGPEEGDSDTFLTSLVPTVDVRCLELLPK